MIFQGGGPDTLFPSGSTHGERERERAGCFTFIVFLLTSGWSAVSFPHGAVGWSVECNDDIS